MISALLGLLRGQPGLTVQQAADQLGVTVVDVRNGLIHLRGLGLVDASPGPGAIGAAPACGAPPGCGDPAQATVVLNACARCPVAELGCGLGATKTTRWTTRGRHDSR